MPNNKYKNGFSINLNFTEDGKSFKKFKDQLTSKISDSASATHQIEKAKEVFSCMLPSYSGRNRKVGLVAARVQSGKTTSFTAVSALAADNDYAAIIHLLGTNLNLKEDNEADVAKYLELAGYDDIDSSFHVVKVQPSSKGGLTNNGIEVKDHDIANFMSVAPRSRWETRKRKTVYYPLLKHYNSIDLLQGHLKEVFKYLNDPRPILIVDDEVDSVSLNTKKPDFLYSKDEDEKATTTYKSLKRLYNTCEIVSYIGYTATAFAIMTAHSTSFLDPDFHVVINPGKGYVGNEQIFGKPDVMRTPQQNRANNQPHQARELDVLIYDPKLDKDVIDWDGKAAESMEEAVCDYLIATIALLDRRESIGKSENDEAEPTSMMLHPDRQTGKHRDIERKLKKFLNSLEIAVESPNIAHPSLLVLKKAHAMREACVSSKYKDVFPTFSKIISELSNEIFKEKRYEIHVLNADNLYGNKSIQRIAWNATPLHFCIGSVALSRGYVVKELITTWMPNEPGTLTADVTEQRMRCLGYKEEYLDLISVYVQAETKNMMRNYSYTEKCLMDDLALAAINGHTIHDVAGSLMHITNLTAGNKKWRDTFNTKISWAPSYHSQFCSNNNTCIHNKGFKGSIVKFLKNNRNKFQSIGKNNIYGASTPAQMFEYATFSLDFVSKDLINPMKSFVNTQDVLLDTMIKKILPRELNKNIDCDVVVFNQQSRGLAEGCINGTSNNFHFKEQPYTSGASLPYLGDRNVMSINDYDPKLKDYKNNTKFTIHIHKFSSINEYSGRKGPVGKKYLDDSYAIQIHARLNPRAVKVVR